MFKFRKIVHDDLQLLIFLYGGRAKKKFIQSDPELKILHSDVISLIGG